VGSVAVSDALTHIAQEQANAMAKRDLLDHELVDRSRSGSVSSSGQRPRISHLATMTLPAR
jgi:uncharacterized protein YkwD